MIRVTICDVNVDLILCSSRTDGIASTSDKNDTFSGVPDSDGHLSLLSWTKDIKRSFEFLEAFALIASDYKPNPVPRDIAVKWMEDFLIEKYHAKTVPKMGIIGIFTAFSHAKFSPWIKRFENPPGYIITEDGWIELSSEKVPTPEEEKEALQKAVEATTTVSTVLENVAPVIVEEVKKEEKPKPELREIASSQSSPPPIILHEPTINDVLAYIRKKQRLIDITEEKRMLETEMTELQSWI